MSEYPQHEKLATVKDMSQAIGEFLEWADDQGWHLAEWHKINSFGDEQLRRIIPNHTEALARYFEIDLDKLEQEKTHMLEAQRASNVEVDQDAELAVVRAATEKLTEQYRDTLEDLKDLGR